MATFNQKLAISAGSALVFLLINLPQTYKLTNQLLGSLFGSLWNSATSCPTTVGIILHAAVFFLVTYLSMGRYASKHIKVRRSLIAALVFLVLSSPFAYKTVRSILGPAIADPNGCPRQAGLDVHTLVYTGILTAMMYR